MHHSLGLQQNASCQMIRNRKVEQILKSFEGMYLIEHYRNQKLLNSFNTYNDIVNQGKNDLLEVYFHDGTPTASNSWFLGLISLSGFTALAASDVMNSHAGWTEFVGYSQATRPPWGPGAAASQQITNPSAVVFDINATGTVKGIFVTTNNTKAGTTGKLWSTALYTTDTAVISGDQIRATYTLSC